MDDNTTIHISNTDRVVMELLDNQRMSSKELKKTDYFKDKPKWVVDSILVNLKRKGLIEHVEYRIWGLTDIGNARASQILATKEGQRVPKLKLSTLRFIAASKSALKTELPIPAKEEVEEAMAADIPTSTPEVAQASDKTEVEFWKLQADKWQNAYIDLATKAVSKGS